MRVHTCKFRCLLTWSGTALVLLPALAYAQPNLDNAPIAENPPNWEPRGGGRGGNRGMGGRGGFGVNLTPGLRQQLWRQRLVQAGVTDAKEQDSVLTYLAEGETAQQKLRDKWTALLQATRDNAITDKQLSGLLNEFRNLVDDEKTRRTTARATLETKLDLSKKPRLDAQLMISGLLGDEASFVQGGAPGGLGGGRGGGFGGPGGFGFGGRGGFGGGF